MAAPSHTDSNFRKILGFGVSLYHLEPMLRTLPDRGPDYITRWGVFFLLPLGAASDTSFGRLWTLCLWCCCAGILGTRRCREPGAYLGHNVRIPLSQERGKFSLTGERFAVIIHRARSLLPSSTIPSRRRSSTTRVLADQPQREAKRLKWAPVIVHAKNAIPAKESALPHDVAPFQSKLIISKTCSGLSLFYSTQRNSASRDGAIFSCHGMACRPYRNSGTASLGVVVSTSRCNRNCVAARCRKEPNRGRRLPKDGNGTHSCRARGVRRAASSLRGFHRRVRLLGAHEAWNKFFDCHHYGGRFLAGLAWSVFQFSVAAALPYFAWHHACVERGRDP